MTFAELVSRAFQLWWRRKSLWAVGVLLALCGRGAYSFSVNVQQGVVPNDPAAIEGLAERLGGGGAERLIGGLVPILLGAAALGAVLWLVMGLLGAWAGAAMVQLSAAADRDEPLTLGGAFGRGRPYALRLFGIELLVALPVVVLTLALVLVVAVLFGSLIAQIVGGVFANEGRSVAIFGLAGALLCLIPLFLLVALFGALLGLLGKLAGRACVLEGLGVRASLGRAWAVARRSFGYLLLLWVMLVALGGAFSVVAGLPAAGMLLVAGPALLAGDVGAGVALTAAALAGYVLLVGVLIGGALTALNETLWTLAYRWFVGRAAAPAAAPTLAPPQL